MGVPLRPLAVTASTRSSYREVAPPPALAGVLACGWHGRTGWARPLRVLPDGCADLVWDGDALTVVVTAGASLRLWVPASASRVGVRLRCGAAGAVLGTPMADLPAGATRLSDLWGAIARRASEVLAATEDPLAQREVLEDLVASRGVTPDRRVLAALGGPGTRTIDIAGELGVSDRALRRDLAHAVGAGPKQVHRIRRFQRFLRRLEPLAARRTSLAAVAADLGYADQSHLGRDCRRLSGSSPAALVRVAESSRRRPPPAAKIRGMTFRVTIAVRADDLDVNRHVRGPAYLAYADHARWTCVQAAGIDPAELTARRIGPVNLETTVRFRRELRGGEVEVGCAFHWGTGKTSRVTQEFRAPDGTLVAEVEVVSGLLDLDRRRLVADPGSHWRELAARPELLGLAPKTG